MKKVTLLLLAVLSLHGFAQDADYNLDYDADGCIGMQDLLGMLSLFGTCTDWSCGNNVDYNGYSYATVQIGDQCWFSENLRSTMFNDSTPIFQYQDSIDWVTAEGPGWCFLENDQGHEMSDFGFLYNFYIYVSDPNICPSGWTFPKDRDWLGSYYDDEIYGLREWIAEFYPSYGQASAMALRTTSYEWTLDGVEATNYFEFSSRPSGWRQIDGDFSPLGTQAAYHIRNTYGGGYAWHVFMGNSGNYWTRSGTDAANPEESKLFGAAVRCVKALD